MISYVTKGIILYKTRLLTGWFLVNFSIMKKLFYISLGLNLTIGCSDGNEILGDCYVSPNLEIICTEEYDPVCAL